MEIVKPIKIPIIADSVLNPDFFYGEYSGIYFITHEDRYGRITFENMDAVKICRGEMMPYEFDYSLADRGTWVFQVQHSKWQRERFNYEKKHYGTAYEFGGDVKEMLTDFKHYLFSFHDQFIEVIARGFWFEESDQSLFQKELSAGHPFLPLPANHAEIMTFCTLKSQIRKNQKSKEQLIHDAQFCSQKLFEFALLDLGEKSSVQNTLYLSYQNGKLVSTLRGFFGKKQVAFDGIASLEQVKPLIEKYMEEVYQRRLNM